MKKRFTKSAVAAVSITLLLTGGCGSSGTGTTTTTETSAAVSQAETTAEANESPAEQTKAPEAETQQPESGQVQAKSEATDAAYLKEYFDVEITADTLDAAEFSENLKKIAGEEAPEVEGELTWTKAVQAAVEAADYKELALSYPEEKVAARLEAYGVEAPSDEAYGAAIACGLDVDLITPEDGNRAAAEDKMTAEDAERLLMDIAEANGDGRNYLGMASDPDIYGKIDQAWNSFILFDDGKLSEVGKSAVEQQVTTGYGIKSAAYDARFLPELTLQYGHSDIKHAHQLIGLLNSENIDAKIQLEPKISIYQYLLDWGPVPEATPTYEVKQFDDLYLVYAVEYDMKLEFDNTKDLMDFDRVIKEYAKKNEGNEEAEGLIYASWWQPLYSTTRTDMPEADYHQIYDCVVTNGMYSIHPFTLPEDKDQVAAKLKELAGDLEVTPVERYCNTAFYSYLKGEDYQ
ncbi:MAG: hypothetical protein Q4C66_07605 [Lachnospiraceae bacterium]|nr:hypothetical protein [Lachnospiraceae bacterium]